ncbi:MAG: hypothetical protein CL945_04190, partial [Dinoroseobacter sp.]|nr:hypothetical protein [Dinoroseobacter sp.]
EDDDTLDGGADEDTLRGGNGDDLLNGGAGDDELVGFYGNDIINGGTGNDAIFTGNIVELGGDTGADTVDGGAGDDLIVIGESDGGHVLTGGEGADRFYFRQTQDGNATITDFDPAADRLEFPIELPQSVIDLGPITSALVDNGNGGSTVVLTMPDGTTVSPVVLEGVPPTATIDMRISAFAV